MSDFGLGLVYSGGEVPSALQLKELVVLNHLYFNILQFFILGILTYSNLRPFK